MSEKYVVGIDSGTQSTRVIIFDSRGKQVSEGIAKHPALISERQGWAEHGELDVWIALCEASKRAFANFDGDISDVVGIGLSSQRVTTMAVDSQGNVIQRPISWLDARLATGIDPVPGITDPYDQFMRLYSKPNWLRLHKPDVFARVYKFLTVSGFLCYKLVGRYADTISNQAFAWPVDRRNWKVSDQPLVYENLGIRPDQMAELQLPGTILGNVTPEAAAETGLPEGVPVIACAGDKQCEILGAGVIEPGQAYITLGTSVTLAIVGDKYMATPDPTFLTCLTCIPGTWSFEAGMSRGYWLISWFRDNFGQDLALEAKEKGVSIEQLLNEEAKDIPAGSEGVMVIPDWQRPRSGPYGKGVILGLDDRHTRAHIFKALIEGISLQLKVDADEMCQMLGSEIRELRAGGGGSKSKIAMQSLADIFGMPVSKGSVAENCSLGAAICAAVGSGLYPSFEEAVKGMTEQAEVFYPIPENQAIYQALRERVFVHVAPNLEPLFKELIGLTGQKK